MRALGAKWFSKTNFQPKVDPGRGTRSIFSTDNSFHPKLPKTNLVVDNFARAKIWVITKILVCLTQLLVNLLLLLMMMTMMMMMVMIRLLVMICIMMIMLMISLRDKPTILRIERVGWEKEKQWSPLLN